MISPVESGEHLHLFEMIIWMDLIIFFSVESGQHRCQQETQDCRPGEGKCFIHRVSCHHRQISSYISNDSAPKDNCNCFGLQLLAR